MAAYFACLKPGDVILGMNLSHGGHLTHGSPVNFSGRLFKVVSYGVRKETGRIDYDEVAALAREHKPAVIMAGASAYPRRIDFARFRAIADEVGAKLMVDRPISRAWWPWVCTRAPFPTPISPPPPRTKPCAARAAA